MELNIRLVLREGLDKTIKCKECGWHWKQSESSKKEMYKCHKCGHDNTPDLNENIQQADKIYFNTNVLSPEVREIILSITHGDNYTRLVADLWFYFTKGRDKHNNYNVEIRIMNMFHQELLNYDKNLFPVKYNLLDYSEKDSGEKHISRLFSILMEREQLVKQFRKLPSVAARNLKRITKIVGEREYIFKELDEKLTQLNAILQTIPNTEKGQQVLNKIFASNNTLNQMIEVGEHFQHAFNMMSDGEDKEDLIDAIQYLDAEVIQDSNNILVVKVNDADSMQRIGTMSMWCFARPNSDSYWEQYASEGYVYVVFDFNQDSDDAKFMMVILPDTDEVYASTNVPMEELGIENPFGYLKHIGVNISLLGHNPNHHNYVEPASDRPYVDPNQLSLFESLKNKVISEAFDDTDLYIKDKIIKGFHLIPFTGGFSNSYTTTNNKVSDILIKQINAWIKKAFPASPIFVKKEAMYNKIQFFKRS